MKALLVTSQVTYVPRNYLDLFEQLALRVPQHLAGLVVLENLSWTLGRDVAGLAALGCRGIAASLTRNIAELPLRSREKVFEKLGLPVLRAKTMNKPEIIEWVRQQEIDLVVNVRTRCIYKPEILSAPRLGCINIHHGILPRYRGTLCDLYALWDGRGAGFTIHQMNEKIDAGRILLKKEISRPGEKDYLAYLARTGREEGEALADLLLRTARDGRLPEGEENRCVAGEEPLYTRNPDRRRITEMRRGGMRL